MSLTQLKPPANQLAEQSASVVVIGGGPVGMRSAQLLAQLGGKVTLLSEEHHAPYNRVRLTPLLGGDVQFSEIKLQPATAELENLDLRVGYRVVKIDRSKSQVITADGSVWPYETLIIATGSRAFVPSITGVDLSGVYTFRTADDVSALLARSFSARRVAVIGGGLLGLEAARGLAQRDCQVTVIEHENRLMPRQLDIAGAQHLKQKIEALGVTVMTGTRVREIAGDHRVERVDLGDGTAIDCDTVVVCTGVRSNIDLARKAGLGFDRGILVNAQMQTADASVYAIGECAQFGTQVVGLVGPGYAQAEAAVAAISGKPTSYSPAVPSTKLKVLGADVFSAGNVEQLEVQPNVKSHVWRSESAYRRIFVERGKLMGVIAVGPWDQASKMQDATQNAATVHPWMLFQFRRRGSFWSTVDTDIADLPPAATVCNCTGVTCQQIRTAIANGASTAPEISAATGAGTVCGTCQPQLDEMVDAGAPPKPIRFSRAIIGASFVATVLALIPIALGYVPMPSSYDPDSLRIWAWRDNIVKQWSGFILLGIMLAAMIIGLRKRLRIFDRLGGYDGWRLVHIGIGVIALAGFFAHTGFRLGSNWNLLLGLAFVLTLVMGAAAGLATGGDHTLRANGIGTARKPARRIPTWLHILAIWPLPVLILFHVLTIYSY